jgi:hypothetical protein
MMRNTRGHAAELLEHVHAKAQRLGRDAVREIHLAPRLQVLELLGVRCGASSDFTRSAESTFCESGCVRPTFFISGRRPGARIRSVAVVPRDRDQQLVQDRHAPPGWCPASRCSEPQRAISSRASGAHLRPLIAHQRLNRAGWRFLPHSPLSFFSSYHSILLTLFI